MPRFIDCWFTTISKWKQSRKRHGNHVIAPIMVGKRTVINLVAWVRSAKQSRPNLLASHNFGKPKRTQQENINFALHSSSCVHPSIRPHTAVSPWTLLRARLLRKQNGTWLTNITPERQRSVDSWRSERESNAPKNRSRRLRQLPPKE